MTRPPAIPPVLVLSTGRCGSTMVSNLLNLHPRVLSLSELFTGIGLKTFRFRRTSGDWMWKLYSRQSYRTRLLLREPFEELTYPFDDPDSRFTRADAPPIALAALPHITKEHDALFDELEPVVRSRPRQSPADHLRDLFGWLCERFDRDVWVERSGGSLVFAPRLLSEFPEARVVHVYRDGRETALSMSRHYPFRLYLATMRKLRPRVTDVAVLVEGVRRWSKINPWLELLLPVLVRPEKLPFDKLELADFAAWWNAMIDLAQDMLGDLPPDRLLNLKFEDVQREPEAQLRRLIRFIDPSLEDEEWIRGASAVPRRTPSRFAKLGAAEQAAVVEACRPGLERLGYPT